MTARTGPEPMWFQGHKRNIDRKLQQSNLLPDFTVATLPDAANNRFRMIFVTDETGGAQPAVSDGTNWRRLTDRAIVS